MPDSTNGRYEMSISLSVLDHLGLNLYSNTPAVISEVIANAWDADATRVEVMIDIDEATITVTDNGHGMNVDDINKRYLRVGYRRRDEQGPLTSRDRKRWGGRVSEAVTVLDRQSNLRAYREGRERARSLPDGCS